MCVTSVSWWSVGPKRAATTAGSSPGWRGPSRSIFFSADCHTHAVSAQRLYEIVCINISAHLKNKRWQPHRWTHDTTARTHLCQPLKTECGCPSGREIQQSHTQLLSQRTVYYLLEMSAEKAAIIFLCKYMLVATSGQSRDSTSAAIETHWALGV